MNYCFGTDALNKEDTLWFVLEAHQMNYTNRQPLISILNSPGFWWRTNNSLKLHLFCLIPIKQTLKWPKRNSINFEIVKAVTFCVVHNLDWVIAGFYNFIQYVASWHITWSVNRSSLFFPLLCRSIPNKNVLKINRVSTFLRLKVSTDILLHIFVGCLLLNSFLSPFMLSFSCICEFITSVLYTRWKACSLCGFLKYLYLKKKKGFVCFHVEWNWKQQLFKSIFTLFQYLFDMEYLSNQHLILCGYLVEYLILRVSWKWILWARRRKLESN